MAALMDRLDPDPERTRLVLVATSGDTGGAVAHAFADRPRFPVVVLFPEDGVSDEQRRLFHDARWQGDRGLRCRDPSTTARHWRSPHSGRAKPGASP